MPHRTLLCSGGIIGVSLKGERMNDNDLFTKLLFNHKHLWIAYQTVRHLKEFPDDDPETVHGRFCDAADEVYQPLTDALLEGQPLQDPLETVLLVSEISQAEGKQF
jgi:hypothetical protein